MSAKTKIIDFKKLCLFLANNKNLKIVLVTGCFDILHRAHKDFLKAASQQGNLLIVGLEPDKRVKLLKGNNRPANLFRKRAVNLSLLEWVDYIFSLPIDFSYETEQLKLLLLIKPNILAVSENTPYLPKKKRLIEKIGGKIFIFPFNSRYSTTRLLTN